MKHTKETLLAAADNDLQALRGFLEEAFQKDRDQMRFVLYHRLRSYCCTIIGCCEAWDLCEEGEQCEEGEEKALQGGIHQTAMRMLEFLDGKIGEFEKHSLPTGEKFGSNAALPSDGETHAP